MAESKKIQKKENEKKVFFYVYKHTFPNGKIYIGITSQLPHDRFGKDGHGYKSQPVVYNAINKYGWTSIKHEIVYSNLTQAEAELMEIELIRKYKSNDPQYGYNLDLGGNHQGKTSEETKKKLSVINMGESSPVAQKVAVLDEKGNIVEIFATISDAERKLGVDGSSISAVCRGKRIRAGGKRFAYYPITEEFQPKSPKVRIAHNAKRVKQIDRESGVVLNIFNSASEAQEMLDFHPEAKNIRACCLKKRNLCCGYKWEYFEE